MRGGAALRGAPQQQLWVDGRCPRCLLRSRASWLTTAPLQLTRSAQGRSQRGAAGAHLEMFPRVSPAWSGVGARLGGLGARGGCSVLVAASVIYWLTRRAGWGAGGGRRWRLLGSLLRGRRGRWACAFRCQPSAHADVNSQLARSASATDYGPARLRLLAAVCGHTLQSHLFDEKSCQRD